MLKTPAPSRATRSIPASSPSNYRGSTIDHERNVELTAESKLEFNALWLWLATGRVAHIQEQPSAIEYFDEDGVVHDHTFDFYAEMNDGLRALVDVKPVSLVVSSGILTVQQLIREQYGSKIADRILLRTEEHMHPRDVAAAKLILRANRMPCEEADEVVGRLIKRTNGWLLIDDVVEATGLAARAFNSILRMIRAGALETRSDQRLDHQAHVRRQQIN